MLLTESLAELHRKSVRFRETQMRGNNMRLLECPVCRKKYILQGLKNHIINTAKAEGFKYLNQILDASKMKLYKFSPRVLIRQTPHLRYYRKHSVEMPDKTKTLKFYRIK